MLIAYDNAIATPLEINAAVNTVEKRIRENIQGRCALRKSKSSEEGQEVTVSRPLVSDILDPRLNWARFCMERKTSGLKSRNSIVCRDHSRSLKSTRDKGVEVTIEVGEGTRPRDQNKEFSIRREFLDESRHRVTGSARIFRSLRTRLARAGALTVTFRLARVLWSILLTRSSNGMSGKVPPLIRPSASITKSGMIP